MKTGDRLYTLRGNHPRLGEQVAYFTHNEKETAVAIAKEWNTKGWKPVLYSFDGTDFKFWFNWRTAKVVKPKAKVGRKAA